MAFLEDICIHTSTVLWREFFVVWGPGNSQGQILPQFSASQSPRILQEEISSKLGQLYAHFWGFISPESSKDGEKEIGHEIDHSDGGGSSSIVKWLDQWLLLSRESCWPTSRIPLVSASFSCLCLHAIPVTHPNLVCQSPISAKFPSCVSSSNCLSCF